MILPPAVSPSAVTPAPVTAVAAAPAESAAAASDADTNAVKIVSPMVGTFYQAPSPEAEPYVLAGDTVDEDTVVCIIEAMKVMNEVKAGVCGTIAEVMIDSAHPVEFGSKLFRIKPE